MSRLIPRMRTGDIAYLLQEIQQDHIREDMELSREEGAPTRKPSPRPERRQGESTQPGEL